MINNNGIIIGKIQNVDFNRRTNDNHSFAYFTLIYKHQTKTKKEIKLALNMVAYGAQANFINNYGKTGRNITVNYYLTSKHDSTDFQFVVSELLFMDYEKDETVIVTEDFSNKVTMNNNNDIISSIPKINGIPVTQIHKEEFHN
jgi:hypothetical protein